MATSVRTQAGVFHLDDDGVCEGVTSAQTDPTALARAREVASQCIGAQYVASIDVTVPGALVQLPRPGANLVFAVVSKQGRVSLVRTSPVVAVEETRPRERVGPRTDVTVPLLADLLGADEGTGVDVDSPTSKAQPQPPPQPRAAARVPPSPTSTAQMSFDIDLAELEIPH